MAAMDRRRLIGRAAVALSLGVLVAIMVVYFERGFVPGDAYTYLAAGERLNAGHPLYALSPGDRPVGFEPPYWNVPLLSPPPIAVAWRPLAALPLEAGVYVWWAFQVAAIGAAFLLVAARRPILASLGLLVLVIPFAYEIGVGNVNGFILLGLILTWRATALGQERATGALAAAMTAIKVTPVLLGWWLLTARRWTALRWYVVAGLAILAVSILGAGLDAHLTYLGIIRDTGTSGTRALSLAGMARYLGVAPDIANLLPTIALAAGIGGIWILRRHPDRAFAVAVATLVFGSPTVNINWFTLLFAVLAPVAWPWPGPQDRPIGDQATDASRLRLRPSQATIGSPTSGRLSSE
jgi:glycosyl transferase family 87